MRFEKAVKDVYIPCLLLTEVVQEGSRRFAVVEPLGNDVQVPYTPCSHCEDEVRAVEPLRTHVKDFYTPCFLCSRGLNHSETVYRYPTHHCVDEVREGSVQSNHSELTSKTSTYLAYSALKWFEKVRGGSLWLNHSEMVYRYPTHLVPTVKMRFEKVRYSRTTPNSRQRLLHTLLSLH